MVFAAITDQPVFAKSLEVDRERITPPVTFGLSLATSVSVSCAKFQKLAFIQQRMANAETDLRQARATANHNGEGARADFR